MVFAASVPLEGVGRLGPLGSAARVAGIAAALVGIVALCTDLPARRADVRLFWFGAFVAWVVASYYWSEDPVQTIARSTTFVQLLILAWLLWQEARSTRACAALMKAFVAGTALACVDALVTRRPAHAGVPRFSIGDPNDFGVVVVIGMVMAYHLVLTSSSRWTRLACIAFMPLATVAVFLTASRTAAIALLLAGIVAAWDRRNLQPRRLVMIAVLVAVMTVSVLTLVSAAQLARIGSVKSEAASGTLDQRTSQWELSFQTFSRHPVTGVGADAFRDVSQRATGQSSPSHNSFLGVATELGVPGLALFVIVFGSLAGPMARLGRRLRRTWLTIALIWLVGASTLSWEHRKITWFLVFLLVAQSDAARRPVEHALRARSAARKVRRPAPAPRVRTRV